MKEKKHTIVFINDFPCILVPPETFKKEKECDFCGDKFYKKVKTPDCGWVNMCEGCYRSYMNCENCRK